MAFTQQERNEYFHYLTTETEGNIGNEYTTKYKPLMEYFLTLTPEEFYTYYIQYKTQYMFVSSNLDRKENYTRWLGSSFEDPDEQKIAIMRQVKEIYKYSKENNEVSEHAWEFYKLLSLYARP